MVQSVRRSWLLAPASEPAQLLEALDSAPDVVVLDLMELVPESDKPKARTQVKEAIESVRSSGAEAFVQVDPELMCADLHAAVWPELAGLVLSRLETVVQVREAESLLDELEGKRGLLLGAVQILASLETARGNQVAHELAGSSSRLCGLTLGRADLVMDLRPEPGGELHLMPYLMQRLITVAGAAGLAPIGAWWRAPARGLLATPEETYQAAYRGRSIGFQGSMCMLPNQVEPLNRGFTPSAADVARAEALISTGEGTMERDQEIVDEPQRRQAASLMRHASACAARDAEKAMHLGC